MSTQRRSHRMRTRAVHAGEHSDPVTGAATANLVMSTTFVTEYAATGFSAQVADGLALASRLPERLELFHYVVSLGHHRSLISYLSSDELQETSFRLDAKHLARYRLFAGNRIFRVSIGLEDPDDLCEDLERALG